MADAMAMTATIPIVDAGHKAKARARVEYKTTDEAALVRRVQNGDLHAMRHRFSMISATVVIMAAVVVAQGGQGRQGQRGQGGVGGAPLVHAGGRGRTAV